MSLNAGTKGSGSNFLREDLERMEKYFELFYKDWNGTFKIQVIQASFINRDEILFRPFYYRLFPKSLFIIALNIFPWFGYRRCNSSCTITSLLRFLDLSSNSSLKDRRPLLLQLAHLFFMGRIWISFGDTRVLAAHFCTSDLNSCLLSTLAEF